MFSISEETARTYLPRAMDRLNDANRYMFGVLEDVVNVKNSAEDGFKWTLLAVSKEKEDENMGLVLKGEKLRG